MKKIHLTSVGFIIMNIVLCMLASVFLCLFTQVDEFNILLFVFCVFLNIFVYFCLYICLTHRIVICEDKLIYHNLKRKEILLSDIDAIFTNTLYLDNTIYIKFKNGCLYKCSGKMTLLGHKKNKIQTNIIVEEIRKLIHSNV